MKRLVAVGLALSALGVSGVHGGRGILAARSAAPLVVHEWGTITTRHAPNGAPQGQLNRINPREVLPTFVRRFEPPPLPASESIPRTRNRIPLVKSPVAPGRPDVTMRLETPVLYFYPPAGSGTLPPFDVSVSFRGGVLNEFYPKGDASVAGAWDGNSLNDQVLGSLRWNGISLKQTVPLPQTSSPIWLAPRNVRSTGVLASSGESERYLFYRGVAHLDALVQTELTPTALRLRAPRQLDWLSQPSTTIAGLWLVDVRADGSAAFQAHEKILIAKNAPSAELATLPLFSAADYTAHCLDDLRHSMKGALVAAGLFDDEAEAMLRTWNESYFQTPGLRVFYIVPRPWIDYHLPLKVSVPAEVTRVLVGRVDIVR
jgi:hypothetical protein